MAWHVIRVTTADPDAVDPSQWHGSVRAWTIGTLTIAPPWLAAGADPARTVIIDPGMGFGTGEHATTRGCLTLLERLVRSGDTVADLGSGSGVLAIAAARLGAARVVGIEHDPDAVRNAEANIRVNGVGSVVTIIEGDAGTILPLVAPARLITANIASLVLLSLLPRMRTALTPDGAAIVSGILAEERRGFVRAAGDWDVAEELTEDGWWTAAIGPR